MRTLSNDVDTAGPVSLTQGVLDGLQHPASVVGTNHQAIQHDGKFSGLVLRKGQSRLEVDQVAPACGSNVSAREERLNQRGIVATSVVNGKEDHGASIKETAQQLVHDIGGLIAARFFLAVGTGRPADLGKEQPQKIRQFR